MKYVTLLSMIPLLLLTALAQEKPADDMDILMEKLKADKKLLVAENMMLTDVEGKGFWPVYDSYQKTLDGMQTKYGEMIRRYAQNFETMTDADAKSLMDDYMKMEEEQLKMRESFLSKFREVLPDAKVARYYQIENKIRAALNYQLAAMIPLMK